MIHNEIKQDQRTCAVIYQYGNKYREGIGRASLVFILRGSLGTVRAQPRFRSHVKSMGDFRLLQITVIQII